MIRTDQEYRESLRLFKQGAEHIQAERARLKAAGRTALQTRQALDPLRFFNEQVGYDIRAYEALKRGEFPELHNFEGIGQFLIAVRIAKGLSQRQLATRLGVHESQVSRDERNEYHGVTVERVERILEALKVEIQTKVVSPKIKKPRSTKVPA